MNRRQRFNAALNHKETDRIPFDIGGSIVTSIATVAYEKLRDKLKLPTKQIQIQTLISMSARIDEDLLTTLGIDNYNGRTTIKFRIIWNNPGEE